MPGLPTPQDVRRLIVEQFHRFGATDASADTLAETILIRDGRYRGRTFRAGGLMAMWMVDIGLIQLYGADGEMLAAFSLDRRPAPHQAAA